MYRSKLSILFLVVLVVNSLLAVSVSAQEDRLSINKDLVVRQIEAFNAADWDALREMVSDDFVLHFPLSPEDIVGPEGFVAFCQGLHTAMPDVSHPEIMLMVAEGDFVADLLPTEGTFTSEWNGIPPTDEPVSVPLIRIWRITDGKLAEAWFGFDTMLLMQQMGVIPGGAAVAESEETVGAEFDMQVGDPETNKAVVRSFKLDLINEQNFNLTPELFTQGFVFHDRADTSNITYTGHAGVQEWLMPYFVMMPDVYFAPDELLMVAEDNWVALRWVARGTHTGEVPDIPASGNEVVVGGLSLYRLEDGKIAETWFAMDTLGFLTQIGVIPMPG